MKLLILFTGGVFWAHRCTCKKQRASPFEGQTVRLQYAVGACWGVHGSPLGAEVLASGALI